MPPDSMTLVGIGGWGLAGGGFDGTVLADMELVDIAPDMVEDIEEVLHMFQEDTGMVACSWTYYP